MRLLFSLLIGVCLTRRALSFLPGNTEESNRLFEKRAYPIPTTGFAQPWPNAKITYCFDTADDGAAKKNLESVIPKAFDLWLNAGLNPAFTMEEGSDDYCRNTNAGKVLTIKYNNQNKLSTVQGWFDLGGYTSTSLLDPSDDFATGSGVANIAHELGHAWGLGHEHQRPSLWTEALGGTGRTATLLFNCENLADYDTFKASQEAAGKTMDTICTSARAARTVKFSALDMIADDGGTERVGDPVDWDSIMIYASTAGGKSDANGNRANTLLKADGSTFGYNKYPSQKDIEALHTLYQDELPTATKKSFKPSWMKGSKWKGMWNKMNKDDSCST